MTSWKRVSCLSLLGCLVAVLPAQAQNLTVGDPAPKLDVSSFVKGEPISSLEPGEYYVVEFWATWCGPCRATIPHLTELQKKHPKVNFIGVSVWEQDQQLVKPFVKEMGAKMSYRVAMDNVPEKGKPMDGAMAKNWMKAAGQNGIPTAFIVNKEDKIAWIGHPASMDEPLEKIVTGSWDLQTAIAEHKKELEARQAMVKFRSKLNQAARAKDPKKLIAVIDEVCAAVPSMEASLGVMKFSSLIKLGETEKALKLGDHLTHKLFGDNYSAYNDLAWAIVDPDVKEKHPAEVLQFAVETAKRSDELAKGKDPNVADTLAKAYFDSGQKAKALETQERAIRLAKGTGLESDKGMRSRLEQYKKAVKD